MLLIQQHQVEQILRQIAVTTEVTIIELGIPVIVTYHAFVRKNKLHKARITITQTDIPTPLPKDYFVDTDILDIMRNISTIDTVSNKTAYDYVLWY